MSIMLSFGVALHFATASYLDLVGVTVLVYSPALGLPPHTHVRNSTSTVLCRAVVKRNLLDPCFVSIAVSLMPLLFLVLGLS